MLDLMPIQASEWASRIDFINWLITVISIFCTLAITAVMLYFAIRYRRRTANDETAYITHNATIETVWTVIPTIVVIYLFWYGFTVYREMRQPPADALEINVVGWQWKWAFEHNNGKTVQDELVVPIGKPVRLIMRSKDVTHSFFIPAMRIKEDVLANLYTYQWFTATKTGEFPIYCTEYCGLNHSSMLAKLKVVTPEQYSDYLIDRSASQAPELPPVELGQLQFQKAGCNQCHNIDGNAEVPKKIGPSLKGIFGHPVELESGETINIDENYLLESIKNPTAKIVKGFPPAMQVPIGLSDKQIDGLVAYIKSLS